MSQRGIGPGYTQSEASQQVTAANGIGDIVKEAQKRKTESDVKNLIGSRRGLSVQRKIKAAYREEAAKILEETQKVKSPDVHLEDFKLAVQAVVYGDKLTKAQEIMLQDPMNNVAAFRLERLQRGNDLEGSPLQEVAKRLAKVQPALDNIKSEGPAV